MTHVFGAHDRPDIDYPVSWPYKVVGSDEARLGGAIAHAVGALEHTVRHSNKSRTGKYISLELVVVVENEAQRLNIGQALYEHADVKFVL